MSADLDWNPPKGKGGKCHHQQRHTSRQSLSLCLCVCVCVTVSVAVPCDGEAR